MTKFYILTAILTSGIVYGSFSWNGGGFPTIPDYDLSTWGGSPGQETPPAASSWIGIPEPNFGLDETYRMYDSEPNRNSELTYHESDSGGYYTHYVDPDDEFGTSTDTDNSYGTKTTPRTSLPGMPLPEGSIVEIHSGTFTSGQGSIFLQSWASETYPTFIRGFGTHRFNTKIRVEATYTIVEDVNAIAIYIIGQYTSPYTAASNVCVRSCDIHSLSQVKGGVLAGEYDSGSSSSVNNAVYYQNEVYNFGDIESEVDQDYHGMQVGSKANYVWLLENTIHTCSGSGVQVLANGNSSHYIYIAGNTVYDTRQSGIWVKYGTDIIISQNTVHDVINTSWSPSKGIGLQYDPYRVWFLFNRVYNCRYGARIASANTGNRDEFYFIGNVIYDCDSDLYGDNAGFDINAAYEPNAVGIYFNVVYNCDNGISNSYYNSKVDIYNNVIASPNDYYVDFNNAYSTDAISNFDYNLTYGSGAYGWNSNYANLAAFVAGTDEGDNSVEGNPLFVDAGSDDYSLDEGSPAFEMSLSTDAQAVLTKFETYYELELSDYAETLFTIGELHVPDL